MAFPNAFEKHGMGRFMPSGAGAWSPSSLGSNLKGWWKADAGVRARTAAQFTAANSETLSRVDETAIKAGDIDFYWCAWVYMDVVPAASFAQIVIKGTAMNASLNYAMTVRNTKPEFWIANNSTNKLVTWGSAISTGTWYFIEGYHDAANDLIGVCVDRGTDVTAATAGITPFSGSTAALSMGLAAGGVFLDGRLGNVGFFKRLPSTAERDAIYNSGSGRRYADLVAAGVSLTSLTGWWEMDENSGTRADKSGNALTLTDNNTVTANDGKVDYDAVTTDVLWKWIDQSATGLLPVQATQANKPTLVANVVNGQAVVRGDGAGDTLKVATGAISNQPLWGWCVVDDNDASTRYYFDGGAASKVALRHDGTNLEVNAGSDVGGAHTAGDFHLVTFSVNGASSEIWVDGTSLATGDAGAQNQDSGIALFADNAGASSLAGDIAELALASGSPTAADLAGLKAYITTRYGLTVA